MPKHLLKKLVMYHAIRIGIAFMVLSILVSTADEAASPKFLAAKENYELKAKVVRELTQLELKNLAVVDLPLDEAISTLSKHLAKAGKRPVNFVVKDKEEIVDEHPFLDKGDLLAPLKKVTLERKSVSYLEALDFICSEGGYLWEIELSEDGSTPIVVVSPRR